MNYIVILFVIVLMIIFILLNFKNNYTKNETFLNVNQSQLNNLFLKNKNTLYKVNLKKQKLTNINECFKKCNFQDCLKLKKMQEKYNQCMTCQIDDNKCYQNLLDNGNCQSCGNVLNKFNCQDLNYFSCPQINDIYNKKGKEPYYLEIINQHDITSPYDQKCLFCWNLKNYI